LSTQTKEAQERAEANFKRKELQDREASKAWSEYQAGREAEREKTARLRLLRLAKEAADADAAEKARADGVAAVAEMPAKRVAATKKVATPAKPKRTAKRRVLVEVEQDS
jgi:hypothetical protein